MATFTVTADIRYLDGTLAGMVIPSGYRVTYTDRNGVFRATRWIERVRRDGDFVRATGTGNRYVFASVPSVSEI